MLDRSLIGRESAPLTYEIERGHVRRFADAIGDPSPIYRDPAAARDAGYERVPAPPTFATCLRPNDVRQGLAIDMRKLLHAEQTFESHRPLLCGDTITVVQRIADVYEKTGRSGVMDFLVLETIGRDEAGAPLFLGRMSLAIRR